MLTIFWIILGTIAAIIIIYISVQKRKKGNIDYREPDKPEKNDPYHPDK